MIDWPVNRYHEGCMPRSARVNQEIRDARREEILVAAVRVFASKGFGLAKIADIASEAGLSHGLVYHYFDSKEEVFAAIVDSMFERVRAEFASLPGATPMARIEAAVARQIDRCAAKPEVGMLLTQSLLLGTVPKRVHDRVMHHVRELHARWVRLIRDAQRAGEIDEGATAEDLASAVMLL